MTVLSIQDQFEEQLLPLFSEKGIILDSFGLRKIEFTEDYKQAVEQKQIEAENIIPEQHRAQQARSPGASCPLAASFPS